MIAQRGYVVCTEARSGSSFLRRLLKSTGVLGDPWEQFSTRAVVTRMLRDPAFLAAQLERASTTNGVYGLKVFTPHFDMARRTRWAERLPNVHFVHLRRHDLLGQALSLVRAQQTLQYKATVSAEGAPRYDRRLIADRLTRLAHGHARWESYFARNGIVPLRLVYEELVADPQGAVDAVRCLVDVESSEVDLSQVELTVQADEVTEEWRRRFIGEMGDRTYLDGGIAFSGRRGGGRLARLLLGPKLRRPGSVAGGTSNP